MEETKIIKPGSIFFTLCLAAISGVLTYLGGVGDAGKILAVFLPPFIEILAFQCTGMFFVKLSALITLWIPQFFILDSAEYFFLFLPVVSLVFAESCLKAGSTGGKQPVVSLIIAAAATVSSVIYNFSQFSLRSYFNYRRDKGYLVLALFAVFVICLLSVKVRTNKYKKGEIKALKYSKWILGIAIADVFLGIETIIQYEWFYGLSAVYCLVWILFFVGAVRFEMPQASQIIKNLKSE